MLMPISTQTSSCVAQETLALGIYQHYKGDHYLVLFICLHSETNEELVIYQKLYGDFKVYARPLSMFTEQIEYNGMLQPRFTYVADGSHVEKFIQK